MIFNRIVESKFVVACYSPYYNFSSDISSNQEIIFQVRFDAAYCIRMLNVALNYVSISINKQ